uniref:Uncharacterized protein n=1 Tax=Ananas comosus var. bracteatus TaxID=296719 RepID=A0A6V7PA93_ANACO|nr:unnamed protein product [Ananas comosus var. bracteatus]
MCGYDDMGPLGLSGLLVEQYNLIAPLPPPPDPLLSPLSLLLSRLRSLSDSADSGDSAGSIVRSLLRLRSGRDEAVARVAASVAAEIRAWIDRETVDRLVAALRSGSEEREPLLRALEARAARGFDARLQDALLRAGAFAAVEAALADPRAAPPRVRDRCAAAALALVRFNRDVFVGPVLMGPAVGALVSAASPAALRALSGLVAAIRSPLIDELHARGALPRLVALLAAPDLEVRSLALELALVLGHYGRKEAVDAMIAEGLIKRLVCLQRSDHGGALIEMDGPDPSASARTPFASTVARFAVEVEVGEGMREREKRSTKQEIVRRVKEAVISPAEEVTVLAEVLWGSTPW